MPSTVSLVECFSVIRDPRQESKNEHELIDILESAIHMVSAYAAEHGVVLGQKKTDDKSNEITAIPALLDLLGIKGCIVTIDAMGCQEKIAEKIFSKEADYVLAVKDNQKQLHEEIIDFFETSRRFEFKNVKYDYFEEAHKGHRRVALRRY